ncbi:MAG TPA: MopE-related protein [Xanthomonadaceae bacterium]|nr:MopE-related protein [Xanthomonadaceae bacterium]
MPSDEFAASSRRTRDRHLLMRACTGRRASGQVGLGTLIGCLWILSALSPAIAEGRDGYRSTTFQLAPPIAPQHTLWGSGACMIGAPDTAPPGPGMLRVTEIAGTSDAIFGSGFECGGECSDGDIAPCYTGPPGTLDVGICRSGVETCVAGAFGWACEGEILPRQESCNGLDDDCDGLIDEDFTIVGQPCSDGIGACYAEGEYFCNASGLVCSAQAGEPVAETCRDGIDNDCDGETDEICGYPHHYLAANVTAAGTVTVLNHYGMPGESVSRLGPGRYRITSPGGTFGCDSRPLMIAADTSTLRPTSYTCSGSDYNVYLGSNNSGSLSDWAFSVVVPVKMTGSATAFTTSCPTTGPCSLGSPFQIAAINHVSTGTYEITSPQCATTQRPVFVQIRSGTPLGYAVTGSNWRNTGLCRVQIFNFEGALRDANFGVWLPPVEQTAWALVSSSGTLSASNHFDDPSALWDTYSPGTGVYVAEFPSWANPSAALVQARGSSSFISGNWFDNYPRNSVTPVRGSANVTYYSRSVSSDSLSVGAAQVIFIQ